jgi:DNA-directed RNA polymerase alpha subunit
MHSIEQGDEFESKDTEYEVEYVNKHIVLLQYENDSHRLERREHFESAVESGQFQPNQPWVEVSETDTDDSQEVPFEDISWVGETGANALRNAGIETVDDVRGTSDERILECRAIGQKALDNIREWVENND